jgi:uncharacterized membrane protein
MIDRLLFALTVAGALGSGVIAGVFFTFSTFVMEALARLAKPAGIAAMQAINITVINPWFFVAFFGTAVISAILVVAALLTWSQAGSLCLVTGGLAYLAGPIFVTIVFNVPLNNALAAVTPDSAEGALLWDRYLSSWTAWNHVRAMRASPQRSCSALAPPIASAVSRF